MDLSSKTDLIDMLNIIYNDTKKFKPYTLIFDDTDKEYEAEIREKLVAYGFGNMQVKFRRKGE